MSNPIRFFEHLRDMYLRYLDSPFDIRYGDLSRERRELLDQDGRIYRYPLIEPVPAYKSSGQSFGEAAQSLLKGIWQPAEIAGAAELVSRGLFPSNLSLHQHQRDVFEEVVANGMDTVVTTGTGSGKTECFLLPVVASIARESASWRAPGSQPTRWDWWNHHTMRGKQRRWEPRSPQRDHETRTAAMRALILYPPQCARGRSACPPAGSPGQPGSEKLATGTPGRKPHLFRSLHRTNTQSPGNGTPPTPRGSGMSSAVSIRTRRP